jgi:FAD/FMN-containing dehydrogenase
MLCRLSQFHGLCAWYGSGQIVGAKLVTTSGKIIDVDAKDERLFGIRGAGTNFGVIVELKVKVHAIQKVALDQSLNLLSLKTDSEIFSVFGRKYHL